MHPVTEKVTGHRVHQLGIIDVRPITPVVTQHEGTPNHGGGCSRRRLSESGPIKAGFKNRDLVPIASTDAHRHRPTRSKRRSAGPVSLAAPMPGRNEPRAYLREPFRHTIRRLPLGQTIVGSEDVDHQRERIPMTHLVFTNALECPPFFFEVGQLDQATVGQFGT